MTAVIELVHTIHDSLHCAEMKHWQQFSISKCRELCKHY